MNEYHLSLSVTKPFRNLTRKRHALIACENDKGEFLLGIKTAYLPGISRLVGGGIDTNEDALRGAHRELTEELQINIHENELIALAEINAEVTDEKKQHYELTTYLYYANIQDREVRPSDDVEQIDYRTLEGLRELSEQYLHIQPQTYRMKENLIKFDWHDYGKLYGPIHRIAYEEIGRIKYKV